MAFHIIYDDGGIFQTYKEEDELIEYSTWSLANTAISENALSEGFVVEALPTEPEEVIPQNVDDAEVDATVTKYDTKIQAVVESVGIPWVTIYKLGTPGSLPPFLPQHEEQRKVYTELVAERAAFADLIS